MNNPNQDLLDLCRLNQLRDANEDGLSTEDEKESMDKVIDWKIRKAMQNIIHKDKEEIV